ncbi:hypothetical protein PN499_19840 [Kamptonema animale CS-326]|jgi:hypothetical protein|uniref:hypothetical protein n=1 Tax=Kamptonema animale TaxID=92934 RepID=UPI002330ACEB|nr:hypothetical protein [Kamptonema animale]MDB9513451.1 hypothetical protein [Kamptonema animale CS-326]
MTRQPHDQFAKQYLEELLTPFGTVEISREVPGEVRQIDLWFAPAPDRAADRQRLGLLGQLTLNPCLLEPFRNQPSKTEIRNCILKLFSLQAQLQRRSRREDDSLPETELPHLWILTTSASAALVDSFGAKIDPNNWPQGVYLTAEAFKTGIVAINQLPLTPETLWLRILGRGATQEQAINELISLPQGNPLRSNVLELLYVWRINLESKENLTQQEQELIMQLSPAYLQWREDTLREGMQQGMQQGIRAERRATIENLLRVRFGSLDEELSAVIEPMLELLPEEFAQLLLQTSRDELLARFRNNQN